MKKYVIPTIDVMKIDTESIIAASPANDLDSENTINGSEEIEAKPYSPLNTDLWADDEE